MNSLSRMFYNDDGDTCLQEYRGPIRPNRVTDAVDVLLGTPVTTLVFCVNPSDCTNYPSHVVSMIGWRKTPSCERGPFRRSYDFFQHVRKNHWDLPQMILDRAKSQGLEFIPSMRMNDAHFAQKTHPREHPLTGQFWLDHQDLLIGPAEFTFWGNEHLLDFKHSAVWEYKLAHAFEIIDRYAQDGFEMDWTRHYTFFKPGREQPELLTEMVREVRKRLDKRGGKEGRHLSLVMRVAASIEANRQCGLDVSTWVKDGLVDYLVPSSPSRCISFDMPVQEWIDLVKGSPVQVHPSPDSAAVTGNGQATLEMYRAAASNYYTMGAHGIYVFNLFCQGFPLKNEQYRVLRDISAPASLDRQDKLFRATPAPDQWRKNADTLPVTLSDQPATIGLWVGDDLAQARVDSTLKQLTFRVRVDYLEPEDTLDVKVNGQTLDMRHARVRVPTTRDTIAFNSSIPSWTWERQTLGTNPGIWFEWDLIEVISGRGDNRITVRRIFGQPNPPKYDTRLVNVDLRVTYDFCGRDKSGRGES